VEKEAHPPTMTGRSTPAMKSFRSSGSVRVDTCSADTTVPWITRMSRPAATANGAYSATRCGCEACRRDHAGGLQLGDALPDQIALDRLEVDLLHAASGLVRRKAGDLLEQWVRVGVPGPQPLEVEHSEPAEPADLDGGGRADGRVHGGAEEGEVEGVGIDLPRDVDVVGVARSPARHDGDVVEPPGPAPDLPDPDVDVHAERLPVARCPLPGPQRTKIQEPRRPGHTLVLLLASCFLALDSWLLVLGPCLC
jgi:hypothetical protein